MPNTCKFVATLNRPHGSRVFKGDIKGRLDISLALFAVRELLIQNDAFEDCVTSIKITIQKPRKTRKP